MVAWRYSREFDRRVQCGVLRFARIKSHDISVGIEIISRALDRDVDCPARRRRGVATGDAQHRQQQQARASDDYLHTTLNVRVVAAFVETTTGRSSRFSPLQFLATSTRL